MIQTSRKTRSRRGRPSRQRRFRATRLEALEARRLLASDLTSLSWQHFDASDTDDATRAIAFPSPRAGSASSSLPEGEFQVGNSPAAVIRVTFDPSLEILPDWNPAGETIAFVTRRPPAVSPASNIGLVESDGTNERLGLTGGNSGFGVGHSPSWVGSTNRVMVNDRLFFHNYSTFDASLAPTTALTRELSIPGGQGGDNIVVSRDGSTVLWRHSNGGGGGTVSIRTAPFSSLTGQSAASHGTLLQTVFAGSGDPQFLNTNEGFDLSPDGSSYVIAEPQPQGNGAFGYDLFLRSTTDGSLIQRLTTTGETDGAFNGQPAFAPDGTHIAFTFASGVLDVDDLHVINLDGTGLTPLTQTGPTVRERWSTWAPDGRRLAYATPDTNATVQALPGEPDNWNVYVLDLGPASQPVLTISDSVVSEADSVVTVQVTLDGAVAQPFSVDFMTVDGTAAGGSDYDPVTGTLNFDGNNQEVQIITIPIREDKLAEGDQAFQVALQNPLPDTLNLDLSDVGLVRILDNDSATLRISGATAVEDSGQIAFHVLLEGQIEGSVSVDVSTVTGSGDALAGDDYQSSNRTIEFADGNNLTESFVVDLVADSEQESTETFFAELANVQSNGPPVVIAQPGSAQATILDDDDSPLFDFGDANPGTYPTRLADNGARHEVIPGFMLGSQIDAESDGPDPNLFSQDDFIGIDDEDGITFLNPLIPGRAVSIEAEASAQGGHLSGWIDFNRDGDWTDPGEQIISDTLLAEGLNTFSFTVPAQAPLDCQLTFARFRYSTQTGLGPTGPAINGEVEDYEVRLRSGVFVESLSQNLSPEDLVAALVGSGIEASNVTFTGSREAAGVFSAAGSAIGIDSGLILSSGRGIDVAGPNCEGGSGTSFGLPGDSDLDTLSGGVSSDATVLAFDFVPDADVITFNYVFSSEEYNEFVNSSFNDVFGFFVNDVNFATVGDGQAVSINTINNGNPVGTDPNSNPQLFRDNSSAGIFDTEMDGLTVVLSFAAPVIANQLNHIKLAIADVGDSILDSNVMIRAGSFSTAGVDYGDLSDEPYATLQANNGARHVIVPGFHLGESIDAESDGNPTALANGDDLDGENDEDGVIFTSPLVSGESASIQVEASANGFLDAWIDFNGDGSFDPNEQIAATLPLQAGISSLSIEVPESASIGSSFARFRFSSTGALPPAGLAADGEVEDYRVTISDQRQPDLVAFLRDDFDPIPVGSFVKFDVTVTNRGSGIAADVAATLDLPDAFSIREVRADSTVTTQVINGNVVANVPSLGVSQSIRLTVEANVGDVEGDFITTLQATTSSMELDSTNNADSEPTSVVPLPTIVGHIFCDENGDGIENVGEEVAGTLVFLDANGNRVLDTAERSTQTDINGDYQFIDVDDPRVAVVAEIPEGCTSITPSPAVRRSQINTGDRARGIEAVDFDNDGDPDLLVASDGSGTVSFLENQQGVFSDSGQLFLGDRPQGIAAWDNGEDSVTAVAKAGTPLTGGSVSVLQNTQLLGTFKAGNGPIDLAVADFDNNGVADVAVASFRSSNIQLQLNGAEELIELGELRQVRAIEAGDVDGDGNLDLVVGGFGYPGDESSQLGILFGDGTGAFSEPMTTDSVGGLVDLKLIEPQPREDESSPNQIVALSTSGVSLFEVRDSEFLPVSNTNVDNGASSVGIGDFNRDGQFDLAIANLGSQKIDLLIGNGNGDFTNLVSIESVDAPSDLVVTDFNGDGIDDIAVANFFQDVSRGTSDPPRFELPSTVTVLLVNLAESGFVISDGTETVVDFTFGSTAPEMMFDVSGEGEITASDALQVINSLVRSSAEGEKVNRVSDQREATDVNGDGRTSAIDALLIINELTRAGERSVDALSTLSDRQEEDRVAAVDVLMMELFGRVF